MLVGGGGGVSVLLEAGRGDEGDLPRQLVVIEGRSSECEGFLLLLLALLVGGAGVRGGGGAGCEGGDLLRQLSVSVGGGDMQPTPF